MNNEQGCREAVKPFPFYKDFVHIPLNILYQLLELKSDFKYFVHVERLFKFRDNMYPPLINKCILILNY